MYISILKILFVFLAFNILLASLLINFFEKSLPTFIVQTFRYGKLQYNTKRVVIINFIEVPKRWFKHFYVVATVCSTLIFILALSTYIHSFPVPSLLVKYLDFIGSPRRKVTTNATSVTLALFLFMLQTWKRLYETFFVSVFSNSRINIIHYAIGITHYVGAVSAIIAEAPVFGYPSFDRRTEITVSDVTWKSVVGTLIFLWAWYHQYVAAVILANLRKDRKGAVVSYDHKMPSGDLFEGVSSPHMFCEMLMYLSLYIILWGNTIWPYVFFWVFCNQCETALLSHWWYKSKFESYPKRRRAFIPFIL